MTLNADELSEQRIKAAYEQMADRYKERKLDEELTHAYWDFGIAIAVAIGSTAAVVAEGGSGVGAAAAVVHATTLPLIYGNVGYQGHRILSLKSGRSVPGSMEEVVSPEYGGLVHDLVMARGMGLSIGYGAQSLTKLGQGKEYLNALAKRTFTGSMAPLGKVNYDAYALAAGIEGSFQTGAYALTTEAPTLEGAGYSLLRGAATGILGRHIDGSDLRLLQKATGHGGLQMLSSMADQVALDGRISSTQLILSGGLGFSTPFVPANWFAPRKASALEQEIRKMTILFPLGVYGPQFGEDAFK